jgi:hypothetical protein
VSNTTSPKLIVGRDGSEVAERGSAVGSDVDVMKDILAIATDSFLFGPASTIERVTMQAARQLATRSDLGKEPRTSA